jgi:phenylacetate-CoA ligase
MTDFLTRVYLQLPAPVKNVAAAVQGYRLLRWRYGKRFRALVPELAAREQWDEERWRAHQLGELRVLLARAITHVPYYRETYGRLGIRAEDVRSLDDLARLPVLAKDEVRRTPERFLADDVNPARLIEEHTSGSTGSPTRLWWSVETSQTNYAFVEARIRNWAGVRWGDRWAMLGGHVVVPVQRRRPPYWIWSFPYRQLYMSIYHISPATAPAYAEALSRQRVRYVYGYASALYALASCLGPGALSHLGLAAVFSNGEPLYPHYRTAIEAAFGARVYDTFSSTELVFLASECAERRMHISPDFGLLETLENDALVATGLLNHDMPLIRYQTGDRVVLAGGEQCACGRRMPLVKELLGRSNDLIITPDGRRVYLNMTAVGKWAQHIREFQVAQDRRDHVTLRVVSGDGYTPDDGRHIQERLQERLGVEVHVELQEVAEIQRSAAGKFRAVISTVTL